MENRAVVGSVFGTTHGEQTVRMLALQACVWFRVVTLLWLNAVFKFLRRDWEPHGREMLAVRPGRAESPSLLLALLSLLSVPSTHRDRSHWV